MPKKKQNRIVAGQNKARDRAKRKARYSGPSTVSSTSEIPETSTQPPDSDSTNDGQAVISNSVPVREAKLSDNGTPRKPVGRLKNAQGHAVITQGNLKAEVLRIGFITAFVILILTAIKLSSF